ncbi:GGDEF domain-containing protein [Marinobacter sp.]|uniref:GGDEF domain-containing protein n=1 Tax=Marinobacter sp. TaxID=50741 RepID=UPI001B6A879C|nr:GGDEF domain-containing protein [Marinobacter sp.]MBQ0834606.1 GGDEF domain-containing protein [Marinobacter sp.]
MQYLLDREIERFKRSGDPVSLMLMDLDHFKQLNDSRGHDAGDKVLQAFADILRQELRAQDLVARWGGEEFLVIMPQCTVSDALKTAERLRVALVPILQCKLNDSPLGRSSASASFLLGRPVIPSRD